MQGSITASSNPLACLELSLLVRKLSVNGTFDLPGLLQELCIVKDVLVVKGSSTKYTVVPALLTDFLNLSQAFRQNAGYTIKTTHPNQLISSLNAWERRPQRPGRTCNNNSHKLVTSTCQSRAWHSFKVAP